MKKVTARRRHAGHPWIFSNEIVNGNNAGPGEVVVVEENRKTIGTGFYHPHSLIAVRLFSNGERDFDAALVQERLLTAQQVRKDLGDSYRWVFSESDGLPGLIIDRYNDYYAVQMNCLGMDQRKELVYKAVIDGWSPKGIYARSDDGLRKLEGLDALDQTVYGTIPPRIEIDQDGLRFRVDIANGQKTGFFFDQRQNRQLMRKSARGEILDCFCYTGAFAIYAGENGRVTGVDSSGPAIELAKENAALNNRNIEFICHDMFSALDAWVAEGRAFDTIIIDPPSFVKSKKKLFSALRGYRELNMKAMACLAKNGTLFTASCSYHVSDRDFLFMLRDAAARINKKFMIIAHGTQAQDHPVMLDFPESSYLKALLVTERG